MTLDEYARYCGPAVIASVYEVDRIEAAAMLDRLGGNVGDGGTTLTALREAVGADSFNIVKAEARDGVVYGRRAIKWLRPTTTQWLRANPTGEYLLYSQTHIMHARDGAIIEDNGYGGSRARIIGYVEVG